MESNLAASVLSSQESNSFVFSSRVITAQWCNLAPSHPPGYNPEEHSHHHHAPARPSIRYQHASVIHKNHLYVFGGWIDGEEEDPEDDEYEEDYDDETRVETEYFDDLWRIEVVPKSVLDRNARAGGGGGGGGNVGTGSFSGQSRFTNTAERRTRAGHWEQLASHGIARWGHACEMVSPVIQKAGFVPGVSSVNSNFSDHTGGLQQQDVLLSIGGYPLPSMELHAYDLSSNKWLNVGLSLQQPEMNRGSLENCSDGGSKTGFDYSKYANTVGSVSGTSSNGTRQPGSPSCGMGPFTSSSGTNHDGLDDPSPPLGSAAPVAWKAPTRYCHTVSRYGDQLVVFGGLQDTVTLHDSVILINTSSWVATPNGAGEGDESEADTPQLWLSATVPETTGNKPVPRFCHTASILGDSLHVVGGTGTGDEDEESWFTSLHRLNLETFVWDVVEINGSLIPDARFLCPSVCDVHGHIFYFGGWCNDVEKVAQDMYIFSAKTGKWCAVQSHVGQYPQQVRGMSCVTVLDDDNDGFRAILFGGADESGAYLNDVLELYISHSDRGRLQECLGAVDLSPLSNKQQQRAFGDGITANNRAQRSTTSSTTSGRSSPTSSVLRSSSNATTDRTSTANSPQRPYGVLPRSGTTYTSSSSDPTPPSSLHHHQHRAHHHSHTNARPSTLPHNSGPIPPTDSSSVHSAMLNMLQHIHRDMNSRFKELEHRLDETNGRVDRLRDVVLNGNNGDGRSGGLNPEQQVANEILLAEVRLLREEVASLRGGGQSSPLQYNQQYGCGSGGSSNVSHPQHHNPHHHR